MAREWFHVTRSVSKLARYRVAEIFPISVPRAPRTARKIQRHYSSTVFRETSARPTFLGVPCVYTLGRRCNYRPNVVNNWYREQVQHGAVKSTRARAFSRAPQQLRIERPKLDFEKCAALQRVRVFESSRPTDSRPTCGEISSRVYQIEGKRGRKPSLAPKNQTRSLSRSRHVSITEVTRSSRLQLAFACFEHDGTAA